MTSTVKDLVDARDAKLAAMHEEFHRAIAALDAEWIVAQRELAQHFVDRRDAIEKAYAQQREDANKAFYTEAEKFSHTPLARRGKK